MVIGRWRSEVKRSLSDTEAIVALPIKRNSDWTPKTDLWVPERYDRADPNMGTAQPGHRNVKSPDCGVEGLRSAVMVLGKRPR